MVDINKILSQVMGSNAAGGFGGGLAGGLASGMLTSKSGRKMGKKALKMGGIAAVGALAYTAFQRYQESQGGAQAPQSSATAANAFELIPAPQGSAFLPAASDQNANDALGLTLVRAMISVARADGRLDAEESTVIFQKIETLELDSDSQKLLVKEMSQPVDMDAIVNTASCPEVAAEIYTASLLAVEVDSAAEKAYLAMLAARLDLPAELVTELEKAVAEQKAVAA